MGSTDRTQVNRPQPPASTDQQLYTEHQQSPRPEVSLSAGGAGPGVGSRAGWEGLAADLGQLLCPQGSGGNQASGWAGISCFSLRSTLL